MHEVSMQRTQIYLNKQDHLKLSYISGKSGKSISQLIREAIEYYLSQHSDQDRLSVLRKARGIWKDRDDYQEFVKIRQELNREF